MERLPIKRVTKEGRKDTEDIVIAELPLTIVLNDRELVTLLCSPTDLKYLAVGFLFSEALLSSKNEIKRITVDDCRGVVRVETKGNKELASEFLFKRLITSGCGRGASLYSVADAQALAEVQSNIVISALEVFSLVREFQHRSRFTG